MASVTGLSQRRLARVRERLELFAGEIFDEAAQRSEQRRWARVYVRGLMAEGRRKSIEPMAARLADGDEQGLQQFVNQSPWRWEPVRANLARRMVRELEPEAWIVDDTGFPKKGTCSVGVARQYSGTLGRVENCQIGGSISAASDEASCAINWRLFCPRPGTRTVSGVPARMCPTRWCIGRSGSWRWRWSTRPPAGACARR